MQTLLSSMDDWISTLGSSPARNHPQWRPVHADRTDLGASDSTNIMSSLESTINQPRALIDSLELPLRTATDPAKPLESTINPPRALIDSLELPLESTINPPRALVDSLELPPRTDTDKPLPAFLAARRSKDHSVLSSPLPSSHRMPSPHPSVSPTTSPPRSAGRHHPLSSAESERLAEGLSAIHYT